MGKWQVHTCRTPPGEERGVARRNGEGYLPPVGRENRVIFGENYAGHPLRRAWGRAPSVLFLAVGRCGEGGPPCLGGWQRAEGSESGRILPPQDAFHYDVMSPNDSLYIPCIRRSVALWPGELEHGIGSPVIIR